MNRRTSSCRKCRQFGEKLCSRAARCVIERRSSTPGESGKRFGTTKLSEYGRQMREKQKVKLIYGVKEQQFHRLFKIASRYKGVTGEMPLSLLERRLDNVLFRLKLATSRPQARQMIAHGHVYVNGSRVSIPSYIVQPGEEVAMGSRALEKESFKKAVIEKRLNIGIKVPEWLELHKQDFKGVVLRLPERIEIKAPIEEHLIVELYSK